MPLINCHIQLITIMKDILDYMYYDTDYTYILYHTCFHVLIYNGSSSLSISSIKILFESLLSDFSSCFFKSIFKNAGMSV